MFKQAAGLGSVLLLFVGVAGCSTPVDQGSPPTAVGPEQPGSESLAVLDSTEALLSPAPAVDRPFQAVAAGGAYTCGIRADGTITCWGWNVSGQTKAPNGRFRAITAGRQHSCGLRTDDTITCWGGALVRAPLGVRWD